MIVCDWVLTPIITLIRTIIRVVREVVRTVCDWVSSVIRTVRRVVETVCGWVRSVIRTVREVVERVCRWLPWPLSELCRLVTRVIEVFETVWNWVCQTVTRLIEVIETVWNWVCREIIDRIFRWIEVLVEYVNYIFRWVCWLVGWPLRLPKLLLCLLGVTPPKFINICVKILTDGEGQPAVATADVDGMVRDAAAIFRRCNIRLVVVNTELVRQEEFLSGTTCAFSGMFSDFFVWFSQRACTCCSAITVYFVRDIVGASGCAYPGTNWVTIAANGDGTTIVQEIGHLADLWAHTSDPNNVMTDQPGGTSDQITRFQCCMIRSSRFARLIGGVAADVAGARPADAPFKRREGAPDK